MRRFICVFVTLVLMVGLRSYGKTYYVRVDGDDASLGDADTAQGAWRSIDRGQPTVVTKAAAAGATEIFVVKATQFPERGTVRIGQTDIIYQGRTAQSLTGCSGVPEVKIGALVRSVDYLPPQAGDEVVVGAGVYFLPMENEAVGAPNYPAAAVTITAGGKADQPVVFKGRGLPVLDGRDELNAISIVGASYVQIEGFDIRRGGLFAMRCNGLVVNNCRVHEGNRGISISYADDVEVSGNMIYDFQGAWTSHGINLGPSNRANVHHNTIVSSNSGVRLYGQSTDSRITNNLIAWCSRAGIVLDPEGGSKNVQISDNNIWRCGSVVWLQREDQGQSFYQNADPLPSSDLHVEPMIVQWDPLKDNFLSPHPDSPCVKDGQVWIGAGVSAPYPASENLPGENLVFNPSFSAGLLGWTLDSWVPAGPDQAGYGVEADGQTESGQCLHLFEHPAAGQRINIRAQSSYFHYTRGTPLTVSFRARAREEGSQLSAGFTFPSWHNLSGINFKSKLTTQWKTYTHTFELDPRYPAVASFTLTSEKGDYWIDDIKVEEGTTATGTAGDWDFAPEVKQAMMLAPGQPLTGALVNNSGAELSGTLHWSMQAPLAGVVAEGDQPVQGNSAIPVSITLPPSLSGGIYALHYQIKGADQSLVSRGKLRFSVGEPPTRGVNHDFFAATPSYTALHSSEQLVQQFGALSAMGLGTLHLYASYDRINDMLWTDTFTKMLNAGKSAGLEWLMTPSDAKALTGKATWAPGPGNVGPEAIEVKRNDLKDGRVTPAQLQAWAEAVKMFVSRFKGQIKYWEILNEPNTFLDGDEYAKVLKVTSAVIRSADPAAVIIGGSIVNAFGKDVYNATLAAARGTYDAFSYHPYRFGLPDPESEKSSYRRDLLRVKSDLSAAGQPVKIFLTEEGMGDGLDEVRSIGKRLGYDVSIRQIDWGEGEILQAQYLARMYLTALGEGAIGYSYHTLQGLMNDSLMNPQLALKAIHTMATLLGDAQPLGQIDLGRDYIGYLFQTGATTTATIWPKDAEYAQPIDIPVHSQIKSVFDLFGRPLTFGTQSQHPEKTIVHFGRQQIYVVFDRADAQTVKTILQDSFKNGNVHSQPSRDGLPR